MKRVAALLLAVLMAAAVLGACGTGKPTEQGLTKVRLAEVTHSVFYAPMYVAINNGFFEEVGIEIELTNAGGADMAMAALLSGSADVAFMGAEASVYVINEGRQDAPVVIGQLTNCDGAFLVSREPEPDFKWENLRGKDIIGGRKGGMPEMTLEYVIRLNGMDPMTDMNIDTSVQFNLMGGAFVGGQGDYVTLFEPAATEVVRQGHGHIVASVGGAGGLVPYTCYQVTSNFLEKNEDLATRFMSAIYKGQQWVHSQSDRAVAEAIVTSFPDTTLATLEMVVTNYRSIDAWAKNPVMTREGYERLLDIMDQAGELNGRPSYDQLIDNSIAEKVIEE
jgi:NitT/TauT family transport system substrate-binding protein